MIKKAPSISLHLFWILAIFLLCANTMHQAIAAEIHVPTDYPVIQAAIDAAENGDCVVVEEGRYTGEGNVNLNFRAKAITVRMLTSSRCRLK